MPIADPDATTTSPCLHACCPRILLCWIRGLRHGPLEGSQVYIHGLCQRLGWEYVNQLYYSFGLDDRYLIIIVTKCYREIWEPVTLTVSLTRKLTDHPLGHTETITAGLSHCLSPSQILEMLVLLPR